MFVKCAQGNPECLKNTGLIQRLLWNFGGKLLQRLPPGRAPDRYIFLQGDIAFARQGNQKCVMTGWFKTKSTGNTALFKDNIA